MKDKTRKHNPSCKCTPENHCGCYDGKPCKCGDDGCGCDKEHNPNCKCTPENHCGCYDGKPCKCGDDGCGCDKEHNPNCKCTPENHCGCYDGKPCKCSDDTKQLEDKLSQTEKALQEALIKANQYLSTASYYKNEAESQKKDFERYKERNKNILNDAVVEANEKIAKKLLPIIDNFDQAMAHTTSDVMKGFEMIYSSLVACLKDMNIVEIEAVGELNPEYHNCITTEPTDDDALVDTIAMVYQKGYKFADTNKVVRPATVSVYKK